jgi:hypothetical protein
VRALQYTQIYSAGRTEQFRMGSFMLHEVTTGCKTLNQNSTALRTSSVVITMKPIVTLKCWDSMTESIF